MNHKELTKTINIISKTLWFPWLMQKYFGALWVNNAATKHNKIIESSSIES